MQNRRLMWRVDVVLVLGLTVFWLGACAAPEPSEPEMEEMAFDGAAVLEDTCTRCHNLDRVTSKQKTRDQWEQTVDKMIQNGADVKDKDGILDYLAETYGP